MSIDAPDREILALQIGRPLRATSTVLRRCSLGLPVVADVPPVLDTGEPFPTLYWLTCPLAHRRIARLEADGGVRAEQARIDANPSLSEALKVRHHDYARVRDARLPADAPLRPSGGVGGSSGGVKCLHAHYADFAAGNDNPVGRHVHESIGEPDCALPCVVIVDGQPKCNPDWREPNHDDEPR